MMTEEERASMVRNAHTLVGEQLDPAWAGINLPALGTLALPVLFTQRDQSPPFFSTIIAGVAETGDSAETRTLLDGEHLPHMTHPAEYMATISRFIPSSGSADLFGSLARVWPRGPEREMMAVWTSSSPASLTSSTPTGDVSPSVSSFWKRWTP